MSLRLLFVSNPPWMNTGYGQCTRYLAPRWQAMGHEVAVLVNSGYGGGSMVHDGVLILPPMEHQWCIDAIGPYMQALSADLLVTHYDVWAMPELPAVVDHYGIRWLAYLPVDHDPVPQKSLEVVRKAWRVASPSEAGAAALGRAGVQARAITVGFDPEAMRPFSDDDRRSVRERNGIRPSDFVIGIVAANTGLRKNFDGMFEVVAALMAKHPNVRLTVHSDVSTEMGLDLIGMADAFGILDRTKFTDHAQYHMGLAPQAMGALYNSCDVVLMTTAGEGFGNPILESQACGVPVITSDFLTGRELNAHAALVMPPGRRYMSPLLSWQVMVNVPATVAACELVMERGRAAFADDCLAFVAPRTWDRAAEAWRVLFDEIERDIKPRTLRATVKR